MSAMPRNSWSILLLTALSATLFSPACNRTPQDYLGKATQLFKEGRYDEASINYRSAIQKDPRFAKAYHDLGMCEYAAGRVDNAVAALTRARELAPNDISVVEDLADVTYNRYLSTNHPQGLYDAVTVLVKQILDKNPDSATGLRIQASLLYGDGKLQQAISTYEHANRISPNDPAIILPLADALRLDNRAAEAERLAIELVQRKPDFAPIYDWLGGLYLSTSRPSEAEKVYQEHIKNEPKSASAYVSLANFYRTQHKDKEAEDTINSMTARSQDFPNCYLMAGDFYLSARNLPAAERAYRAGMTGDPAQKSLYLIKLAYLYTTQQKNADALQALNEAVQDQPDDWEAQGLRISLLLATKEPAKIEEAINSAKAMQKKRPTDGRFPELLARAYEIKGDRQTAENFHKEAAHLDDQFAAPRLALAEISKARRDSLAVLRYSEEILRASPKNAPARLLHAWALIDRNDLVNAEEEMQALVDDYPDSYDVNLQMGLLYIAEKRTRSALDVFDKLLQTHPGDQRILAGLATAYFQGHSYDAAIQLVTREVQKNPASETTRAMLARLALHLGKVDVAMQQYKTLADEHPQTAEYQAELGALYAYTGDKENAVKTLEIAARLMPNDADQQGRLALAYYAAGKIPEADAAYAKSVALKPADPTLLNNRAYFLAESGTNPDEALRLAQTALAKSPENPSILDTLALCYAQKKMGDNAFQILQPLVLNYPNEPMFRYHLAMALILRGDKDGARKQLEGSLSKHPSKDDLVKIKALLSRLG